jgi:tripartite-type tricarboxylate transporter receptor subunit TctC
MKLLSAGLSFLVLCGLAVTTPQAHGEAVSDFYKGKQVRIIVGAGEGGMNSMYARLITNHIGRHIPGNPSVILQNMEGAGGIKAANYVYSVASRDGLVLFQPHSTHPQSELLGEKGISYNSMKFLWLGRSSSANSAILVWHTVPVKTLLDCRNVQVIMGSTGKGAETYTDPTILNDIIGTKFKVITGYKGGTDMDLALERGETSGDAGPLLSVISRHPNWIKDNLVRFIVQLGETRHPKLANVPLLTELARNDEERAVFEFLSAKSMIGRAFVAPPGTPPDRVAALRKALADACVDPLLLAEAAKLQLDVIPASAQATEGFVKAIFNSPPAVVARVKKALELD